MATVILRATPVRVEFIPTILQVGKASGAVIDAAFPMLSVAIGARDATQSIDMALPMLSVALAAGAAASVEIALPKMHIDIDFGNPAVAASVDLPSLQVTGEMGRQGGAEITFPALTVATVVDTTPETEIVVPLPAMTVSAETSGVGEFHNEVGITLPALTLTGTASMDMQYGTVFLLPVLAVAGRAKESPVTTLAVQLPVFGVSSGYTQAAPDTTLVFTAPKIRVRGSYYG